VYARTHCVHLALILSAFYSFHRSFTKYNVISLIQAAKNGIFTWSKNPNQSAVKQKNIDNAASMALEKSGGMTPNRGGMTTNLTLDEILSGKAKLTRMNGEKAG
jgi:hypothetical protein